MLFRLVRTPNGILKNKVMESRLKYRNIAVESICLLYLLLFSYTAINKLILEVPISNSTVWSSLIKWPVLLVSLLEFCLALLFVTEKKWFYGLLGSLSLTILLLFHTYIIIQCESIIPCSCGFILDKINWKQHLIFNIFFTSLGLLSLLIPSKTKQ